MKQPVLRNLRQRRQAGQTAVFVALCFVVLIAFAGLAIDGGHVYLINRRAQNATDAAALAAAKQLSNAGTFLSGPPASFNDPAVKAAHDLAYANGFPTTFDGACTTSNGTTFSSSWYAGGSCGSTSFDTRVTVNSPPTGPMSKACQAAPYNCLQVVISQKIENYLMGVLGVPVTYSTTTAVAYAQPPQNSYAVPPPAALYLYEPAAGCTGTQCFNPAAAPSRTQLSCAGGNCPTFWSRAGTHPTIAGVDGKAINSGDQTAVQSNGTMVIQDRTTFCDPYGGATCNAGVATGADGFAVNPGAQLFCTGFAGGGPNGYVGCGAGAQTGLSTVSGNETGYSPRSWTDQFSFTGPDCGSLVLNGGPVRPSNPACNGTTAEPYTILPGRYSYIVINHGKYDFEAGVYDITGTVPANLISHGRETAADFDLCGASCPTLTAGIWIGHGNNAYTAGSAGSGSACTGNSVQGGGGDNTIVTGSGVTFRFESASAGFVSTHEVSSIDLSAPGLGSAPWTQGVPILFDMENPSFIHLDAGGAGSHFTGIVYQSPSYTAGGVEVNPGLGQGTPALSGQVLAYSFTTFGTSGTAIDFSKGFGASSPIIATGNAENQIIPPGGITLRAGPVSGTEQLVILYNDEWALNAYDAYVRINSGNTQFFSQGIWQVTPQPNDPLPPNPNGGGPSDVATQSARPDPAWPGANNYTITTTNGLPDWTYKFSNGSTFEVSGNWTWGHESNINGAQSNWTNNGGNNATLTYTFPTPVGTTVNVLVYLDDGDHCGDYTQVSTTFANIGQPAGGQQVAGSVRLEQ
jgi:Flp pilus assembly protein TadG